MVRRRRSRRIRGRRGRRSHGVLKGLVDAGKSIAGAVNAKKNAERYKNNKITQQKTTSTVHDMQKARLSKFFK